MTEALPAPAGPEAEPNPTIRTAVAEIRTLMDAVARQVNNGGAGGAAAGGKFFPNGIELIFLKVEAGLTEKTKVSFELKIAGEKGLKPAVAAEEASPFEAAADQEVEP